MAGTITPLHEIFYQCKFTQVIAYDNSNPHLSIHESIVVANAYFELHKVQQAKDTLSKLMQENDTKDETDQYLYLLAKLNYFERNFDKAYEIFNNLYLSSEEKDLGFKALLGKANVLWSQNKVSQLPKVVDHLLGYEPLSHPDDRISLAIFLANYHTHVTCQYALARSFLHCALSLASRTSWNYFIIRCFYGWASLADIIGNEDEVKWNMKLLQSFVDVSESRYFSHLVNKKFERYGISLGAFIEFDPRNKRVMVEDRWINLADKPQLYRFLDVLHENEDFVSVVELKNSLWPHEEFDPSVHKSKLDRMAKELRHCLERYEYQPVVLLENQQGFKLAIA